MSDLSSVSVPTSEGADPDEMVRATIAAADAVTERSNTRDLAGRDGLLHVPRVILSGEELIGGGQHIANTSWFRSTPSWASWTICAWS